MPWLLNQLDREQIREHRWSVASLIAANALPLLGVLMFGWSTFEVVLLYWFENVVLGAINVLKMICCTPDLSAIDLDKLIKSNDEIDEKIARQQFQKLLDKPWLMQAAKLFFIPFFTVHYGMFCFVHGIFVVVLLSGGGPLNGGGDPDFSFRQITPKMVLAAVALAGSHLVSFFVNYLGRGEYRRTILPVLMFQPYGRIVVLHVAIIFGAFAIVLLGSPVFLLLILIVGKTLMDLALHLRQHRDTPVEGVLTTVEPRESSDAGD